MQNANRFSFWPPNRLVTLGPKGNNRRSDCGSQVRDAGIVADEGGAFTEASRKFGQWQGTRELKALTRKSARKALELSLLSLAANEQDLPCRFLRHMAEQL